MNEFTVCLDLAKGKARQQQTVFVRQGDQNGTTIVATITDHGVAANTSGMTARFQMRLPDGTHYYRKAASLSGNVATVALDEAQAASVAGRTDVAYFQLLQGSTVVASTESFTIVVLPDALADAEVAESYDSAIQDAIDALDAAVADMPDMVEDVLADHPEWTTTVQDGSITKDKLATDLALDRERLMYRLDNMLTAQLPEGETATATDAAKTPVAGLALYGRSTQDGTPTPSAPVSIESVGTANLIKRPYKSGTQVTTNGITWTVNDDGTITANGTATANSNFILNDRDMFGSHPQGTYTLSGSPAVAGCYVCLQRTTAASGMASVVSTAGNPTTFTTDTELAVATGNNSLFCRVPNGTTVSNAVFRPMLSAGSTAYPYVPYGNVGLWARGRNLVRSYVTNSYTYNGITWEYVSEGMIKASGSTGSGSSSGQLRSFDLGVLPAGTYTVTMTPVSGTISGTGLAVSYRTGADASVAGGVLGVSSGGKVTATLTTDGVRRYWLQPYVRENSTASNLVLAMQVQVGAATPFQPYEQTVTPIPLQGHELRSLPDGTRDELTVDARGHAVLTRRTGFVSAETLAAAGKTIAEFADVVRISYANVLAGEQSRSYNGNPAGSGWCNVAPYVNNYTQNAVHAYAHNTYAYVFAPKADKSAWNATTATEWTNEHAPELVYALATPVTHDLGYVDAVPLCGPDLTAQAIPTAPFALTYERDLNTTLARLESAIATLA